AGVADRAKNTCSTDPQGGGPMRLKHSLVAVATAAAVLLPAHPARAENPTWSFSALGGYGQFSNRLHYPALAESLDDAILYGGRFSRGLGQFWALEAGGSFSQTKGLRRNGSDGADVTMWNVSGSLIAQLTNDSRWGTVYILGGGGYTQYKADGIDDNH